MASAFRGSVFASFWASCSRLESAAAISEGFAATGRLLEQSIGKREDGERSVTNEIGYKRQVCDAPCSQL